MRRLTLIDDRRRDLSRISAPNLDVLDWLKIWEGSQEYFDGTRDHGYGGYNYDGRWKSVVNTLIETYNLSKKSTLLDVGCAKGYLVNDYQIDQRVGNAAGVDISLYALVEGKRSNMLGEFFCSNATNLPFENNEFDLLFCKDTLHNILNKKDVVAAIKEIKRVSKMSWIRVGAYKNQSQKTVLDRWATFATSYFSVSEWKSVFDSAEYDRDYDWFHPSEYIDE